MPFEGLKEAARRTLVNCMGVRAGETVTVVTDDPTRAVGEALAREAGELGAEPVLAVIRARRISGEEPPAPVAALMRESEVLLLPTSASLSHTRARKAASEAGARCASMPGITEDMMARTMAVNYGEVAARSRKLADALKGVRSLGLTSAAGTDLTINVTDLEYFADTGVYHAAGDFGNLPAGEVCAGPVLEGSTGVAAFDGSFGGVGLLAEPIVLTFEDGVATSIEGGKEAETLAALIEPFGAAGKTLAEIGIGTHPTAKLTGAVLEDEKIAGTVHLALGNNVGFGGSNDVAVHVDGVILSPTLVTDGGVFILKEGVPEF
ncbi:MAG: aminopeptidase [candidate division Zixibacteria bacterium]|nr:aminopeptidase [candidate division Zixibacteria bacterium]